MIELLAAIAQPLTLAFVGLIIAVSGGLIWQIRRSRISTCKTLNELQLLTPSSARNGAYDAIKSTRVRVVSSALGERWILRAPVESTLHEWLEVSTLRQARFEAGAWITGGALLLTFFLIAKVLAESVGPAIKGGGAGMDDLSQAVTTMGGKFVVSMTGIAMSIWHGFVRNRATLKLYGAANEAALRIEDQTVTLEAYQNERDELNDGKNTEQFRVLLGALGELTSIKVSVSDIGSELADKLKNVVTRDIVDGIGRALREMADDLEAKVSSSFAKTLDTRMTAVVSELTKIEAAVSSQAKDQVGELLQKLAGAVSGGFSNETAQMKEALLRFAEVVPQLETQMRTMMQHTGQDLARQSSEAGRLHEALMSRLEHVLASITEQQRAAAEANTRVLDMATSTHGSLATAVANANEQIITSSKLAVDELSAAMRAVSGDARHNNSQLISELEASAKVLQQARTDSVTGASRLAEAVGLLRDVLRQTQETSRDFALTAASLDRGFNQTKETLEAASSVVQASSAASKEMQMQWPKLADQYLQDSNQAFEKIAGSWKGQVDAIESSVRSISSAAGTNASAFSEAVESLADQIKLLRERKAGMQGDK